MNHQSNGLKIVLFVFFLYLIFSLFGIVLAYLLGLGWFFLFQTMNLLFVSSPRLYLPIASRLMSKESTDRLREKLLKNKRQWFWPRSAIFLILINVLVTVFAFWKINIPLHVVLAAFISGK
jgi:hypothetical protein